MFTSFNASEISEKELYCKLSSSFQIACFEDQSVNFRFTGLYAIFKNGICYYVGQSQNLASRICQHLSGKYKSADQILILTPQKNGFSDFFSRDKQTRKEILEYNESILIKKIRPIENLLTPSVDMIEEKTFECLIDLESKEDLEEVSDISIMVDSSFQISVKKHSPTIDYSETWLLKYNQDVYNNLFNEDKDMLLAVGFLKDE
jgi:hypothetical protein